MNSQVKITDAYIIIHPNFEIGDKRIVTETTFESIQSKSQNSESKSTVKQLIEITDKTKSNYEIEFKYEEFNLESLNTKLNQYYKKANKTDLGDISNFKLNIDKWGYYDSLSFVNLTEESLIIYESNFMKFTEWLDAEFSKDSLPYLLNYSELINNEIVNKKYERSDITELLFNIALMPLAFNDNIIPIESISIDSINSELSFIEGELKVLNEKSHKLQNNTFELISNNRFLIPAEEYPILIDDKQITHLEWEENQTYLIEKDTGWPIEKRTEIKKVFNDKKVITIIKTKFDKL